MSDILTLVLVSLVVFATHFVGALTGFGSTVLAMPFIIALIGIETGKPMLLVFGILQPLAVVIANHKNILWPEVKRILIGVGLGMPFGMMFYRYLPQDILLTGLSIFMIIISIKGIIELRGYTFKTPKQGMLNAMLFSGGIIHGAFVSGGPLVMIYSSEKIKDKNEFRASMSVVWVVLNIILIVEAIMNKNFNGPTIQYTLVALPALLIGVGLGNKLSARVNQNLFKFIIYIVLLISAMFNLFL